MKEKIVSFFKNWKVNLKKFFFSFVWLAVLMVILDQVSKIAIVMNQDAIRAAGSEGVILIPNFLAVNYLVNTNVVFGLSFIKDKVATRAIYIVIALIMSGGLIFYYVKKRKSLNNFYKATIMLILSGAIGNLIDRCFYNANFLNYTVDGEKVANGVVDWINFYGIWKFNFNWADSCIVVGCFMLIIYVLVIEIKDSIKKHKLEAKKEKEPVTRQLSLDEQKKLERENRLNQEELEKRNNKENLENK